MKTSKESNGFLFIPDISGFSEFVNSVEITHSKHIISELLDIILKSNELEMKVAEIEGDAIFLYCENVPSFEVVMSLTRKTFINFHHHLKKYETLRICQCGACRTAHQLTLKFIAHADHFSFLDVGGYHKPYGASVILLHRLMKNPIPVSEYLLLTNPLRTIWSPIEGVGELIPMEESYADIGRIHFSYLALKNLHALVPPVEHYEVPQKSKHPHHFELLINSPLEKVQTRISDLNYKLEWMPSIKAIRQHTAINNLNNEHFCIIQNKEYRIRTIKNNFDGGGFVYGEKIINPPMVDSLDLYFILKNNTEKTTLLIFELHIIPRTGFKRLFAPLIKLLFRIMYRNHLKRFKKLVEIGN